MFDHVPPAPRSLPVDARRAMIGIDRAMLWLLLVMTAAVALAAAWAAAASFPNALIEMSPATTEGIAGTPVSRPEHLTVSYRFGTAEGDYHGEIDTRDRARFAELAEGDPVSVEYCSFWPRQSRLAGTRAATPMTRGVAVVLLVIIGILLVLIVRKRNRIALRERTYREGVPTEGEAMSFRRIKRARRITRWVLRYRYRVPGPEDEMHVLGGEVISLARDDLAHLNHDDLTVLYLEEEPTESIPHWDEHE